MIELPAHYGNRIEDTGLGFNVYGDNQRIIFLGRVNTLTDATKLLDGYDGQLERRQMIANAIREKNEDEEKIFQIPDIVGEGVKS